MGAGGGGGRVKEREKPEPDVSFVLLSSSHPVKVKHLVSSAHQPKCIEDGHPKMCALVW